MSPVMMILTLSLAGLIACVAHLEFRRHRDRRFLPGILMLTFALALFVFARADSVETKGPLEEMVPVVFCYVAMLLGMVAEYGYRQAEQGRKRFRFELMEFLMPVFASPIVFIPLLTITTDMSLGGAFTKSKLMVYLVAFQNGFFWKSFFEQRRRKAAETMVPLPVEIPEPAARPMSKAAGR
jgi:hypothetical protein